MLTRKDYLNANRDGQEEAFAIHSQYYGQFVTEEIKFVIQEKFGFEKLVSAFVKDPHFNTIPLRKWDSLILTQKDLVDRDLLKRAGEGWSLVAGTCIFKEAARQLVQNAVH